MLVHVSLLYRGEEDNTRSECQLECIKNAILEERRSIKGGIVPVCSGGQEATRSLYSVPYLIPFALYSTRRNGCIEVVKELFQQRNERLIPDSNG